MERKRCLAAVMALAANATLNYPNCFVMIPHGAEVVITISGEKSCLWRAVDQHGYVLDEIAQTRGDAKAARQVLTRLLRKQGCPPKRIVIATLPERLAKALFCDKYINMIDLMISAIAPCGAPRAERKTWRPLQPPTNKLGSYGAARHKLAPKVEHRRRKGLNNRAENSRPPTRRRERIMRGFRSWPGLQRFVSTFSAVRNHFVPPRSQRSVLSTRLHRPTAMDGWKSVATAA